jgi:hypothetical protein
MLKGVFLYCIQNQIPLCGRKIQSAADFLYLTDVSLLGEGDRNADKDVAEMVSNIVDRRLFKRALVISTMNGALVRMKYASTSLALEPSNIL